MKTTIIPPINTIAIASPIHLEPRAHVRAPKLREEHTRERLIRRGLQEARNKRSLTLRAMKIHSKIKVKQ